MPDYIVASLQVFGYCDGRREIVSYQRIGHPSRAADDTGLANFVPLQAAGGGYEG